MGMYDGVGGGSQCSAYALAKHTGTPVILVVDASGSAASAAATALGFLKYREDSGIAGVFVNRASSQRHYELVKEAVGTLAWLPAATWMGILLLSTRDMPDFVGLASVTV